MKEFESTKQLEFFKSFKWLFLSLTCLITFISLLIRCFVSEINNVIDSLQEKKTLLQLVFFLKKYVYLL